MTEPEPPDVIPAYIADGIARQDRETLAAIEDYAQARREYLETLAAQSVDETALADSDEELVDVEESQEGTVVIKRVPCGKDCSGCPHGPYKYIVRREGEHLKWTYKGPVSPP